MSKKKNIEIRYHSPEDLQMINTIKTSEDIPTKTKLLKFLLNDYYASRKKILKLKSDNIRLQIKL